VNKLAVLAVLAAILTASSAIAQVKVDRFYPSAVGPGEMIVTAEGKLPTWPCELVCDRADVTFACEEKSGQVKVTVAQDAAPGVAWIRLYDQKSASNLVPLLIESVAVTPEATDAKAKSGESSPLALPSAIAGRLAKSGEVDAARVSIKSGDTLVASLIASQILQSPMDAVLQITDLNGNVLSQSDDVRGLDPQLVYRADADIEAIIRLFAFPATPNSTVGFSGSDSYTYVLRLTTGPFLDHVSPIAIGVPADEVTPAGWNLAADAVATRREATEITPPVWHLRAGLGWHWQQPLDERAINLSESSDPASFARAESLPVVFCGRISEPKQVDRVRFQVTKGKQYNARSYAKSGGYLHDAVLRVIDVDSGKEIVRKDDISRTDFDAAVDFKAATDGEYELQVSDAVEAFGIRHVYAVLLQESLPSVRLSVAADQFSLSAGGSLEIPVAVTRTNGFAEKISVAATGLPAGVTVTPIVSEVKGDTAKSVKLKLSAQADLQFQGNINVVGTTLDSTGKPTDQVHTATFPLPAGLELGKLWLTVAK
jgi:hypothetical protein